MNKKIKKYVTIDTIILFFILSLFPIGWIFWQISLTNLVGINVFKVRHICSSIEYGCAPNFLGIMIVVSCWLLIVIGISRLIYKRNSKRICRQSAWREAKGFNLVKCNLFQSRAL